MSVVANNPETYHAPAERLPVASLQPLVASLKADATVTSFLNGYPEIAVLLNQHRQIVACNRGLMDALNFADDHAVVGRRVGEVIGCVHAAEAPGGCGTSESCRTCGAVNAMLECWRTGETARQECRVATGAAENPQALDLRATVSPFSFGDDRLMIFAAQDIASVKRREALERIFFHDILNVAGAIEGLATLLGEEPFNAASHPRRLHGMARQLIEQIRSHRDLAAAERDEFSPSWATLRFDEVLDAQKQTWQAHPVARERTLLVTTPGPGDTVFQCDRVLLDRVLGNLIKNALEASELGAEVAVNLDLDDDDHVRFTVHNPSVMPREVQLQVFKRSFSTKGGTGRGLGTFSVKLFVSRYLKGEVSFHSAVGVGTTFTVVLPRRQTSGWQPVTPSPTVSRAGALATVDGCRVLLVEDGPDNQRLITIMLERAGVEVVAVDNGQLGVDEALAARDAGRPYDVILMDMQMPVMDGYAATTAIRRQSYAGPIVALTAHANDDDRQRCLDAGCNDYATKPIRRQQLLETIQRHLPSNGQDHIASPA